MIEYLESNWHAKTIESHFWMEFDVQKHCVFRILFSVLLNILAVKSYLDNENVTWQNTSVTELWKNKTRRGQTPTYLVPSYYLALQLHTGLCNLPNNCVSVTTGVYFEHFILIIKSCWILHESITIQIRHLSMYNSKFKQLHIHEKHNM